MQPDAHDTRYEPAKLVGAKRLLSCLALTLPAALAHAQHYDDMDRETRGFLGSLAASDSQGVETMSPAQARDSWDQLQTSSMSKAPAVIVEPLTIETPAGKIGLHIVRPAALRKRLPVIVFFHGGGWIMGNYAPTHERLVRELADGVQATVVVVDYALSPQARYPLAVDQCFEALKWVAANADQLDVYGDRLAVAGNSVGGTLAAVTSIKAIAAGGPRIRLQALLWPVTDAGFRTESYRRYAEGYLLTASAMRWMWEQYIPDPKRRLEPMASPLRATNNELRGLPPALVQTAEFDIVRDEGEQYAHRMMNVGVRVSLTRYGGTVHDFGLLNALKDTSPARSAMRQLIAEMRAHLR